MVRRLHEAGHRGHPRRGLQPHRRGQPSRPDALLPRHRQRQLLHARRRTSGYYFDATGCGNTVNLRHPRVLQMVMDSLRYWVEECHVDGFRFDLATSLGREYDQFDPNAVFFDAVRQDPVLAARQADRRALGRRPERLPARQFPARLGASGTAATATTCARYWKGDAGAAADLRARHARLGRPLRAPGPEALGERQLRHRP